MPSYKQTDVGLIPEDWYVRSIAESMRLVNGRAFKPSDWVTRGLPIIRIQNLNDPKATFNYFFGPVEEKYIIEAGDLLFAWSGTTGTSFGARVWHGPTGILNQHIFKVLPDKKKLSTDYALLVLLQVQEKIEKQAHGFKASFVHVKKSDLVGIGLPLPPTKTEQDAIAESLNDVNALIESLEQLLAKKRDIKRGAMQELLSGKTRLPGFKGQWMQRTLLDLAAHKKELFDDGDWVEAEHITDKGIRLVQTGNIGIGAFIERDEKKYIFEQSFRSLRCKEIREGDLLVCRLADPAGRACVLPDIGSLE